MTWEPERMLTHTLFLYKKFWDARVETCPHYVQEADDSESGLS